MNRGRGSCETGKMASADFRALGLRPGASIDDARHAFRRLALRLHPDKNPSPDAQAQYVAKAQAYEAILRAGNQAAEADTLLKDPFADIFGANWARSLAEGSTEVGEMLERGKERAELGGDSEPLADFGSELGLDGDTLAALMAGATVLDGGDEDAGGNPFKDFFDSLPASERPQMMALFEKTFPAFLAQEMAETQLEAENELFRRAVEQNALPAHSQPPPPTNVEVVKDVEALNADAVAHFHAITLT